MFHNASFGTLGGSGTEQQGAAQPSREDGDDGRRSRQPGRWVLRTLGARREQPEATSSASAPACPDCGSPNRDPVESQFGYCPRCRDFTGLCGAGRRIVCPDIMTKTSWHHPCTNIGVTAWEIAIDKSGCVTLLCQGHDAQVTAGSATWIKHARRLTAIADPAPADPSGAR